MLVLRNSCTDLYLFNIIKLTGSHIRKTSFHCKLFFDILLLHSWLPTGLPWWWSHSLWSASGPARSYPRCDRAPSADWRRPHRLDLRWAGRCSQPDSFAAGPSRAVTVRPCSTQHLFLNGFSGKVKKMNVYRIKYNIYGTAQPKHIERWLIT